MSSRNSPDAVERRPTPETSRVRPAYVGLASQAIDSICAACAKQGITDDELVMALCLVLCHALEAHWPPAAAATLLAELSEDFERSAEEPAPVVQESTALH